MRVTSDRVAAILQDDWYPANHIVLDICRDWLDMQAVIAAAKRVARDFPLIAYGDEDVVMACAHCMEMWVQAVFGEGPIDVPHADDCPAVALIAALASLTPARDETVERT